MVGIRETYHVLKLDQLFLGPIQVLDELVVVVVVMIPADRHWKAGWLLIVAPIAGIQLAHHASGTGLIGRSFHFATTAQQHLGLDAGRLLIATVIASVGVDGQTLVLLLMVLDRKSWKDPTHNAVGPLIMDPVRVQTVSIRFARLLDCHVLPELEYGWPCLGHDHAGHSQGRQFSPAPVFGVFLENRLTGLIRFLARIQIAHGGRCGHWAIGGHLLR